MKIRSGFVSNSSSSSFLMLVVKDAYDEILKNLDPLNQAILNHVMSCENILGRECMVYSDCSSEYWWDEIDKSAIIEEAKTIANGQPLVVDADAPTDPDEFEDYMSDIISDNVGEWSVKKHFNKLPKDQFWTHDMDW